MQLGGDHHAEVNRCRDLAAGDAIPIDHDPLLDRICAKHRKEIQ
jgi:hypothetical protein